MSEYVSLWACVESYLVRISTPSSVISTVCSNWAERLLSICVIMGQIESLCVSTRLCRELFGENFHSVLCNKHGVLKLCWATVVGRHGRPAVLQNNHALPVLHAAVNHDRLCNRHKKKKVNNFKTKYLNQLNAYSSHGNKNNDNTYYS